MSCITTISSLSVSERENWTELREKYLLGDQAAVWQVSSSRYGGDQTTHAQRPGFFWSEQQASEHTQVNCVLIMKLFSVP